MSLCIQRITLKIEKSEVDVIQLNKETDICTFANAIMVYYGQLLVVLVSGPVLKTSH